MGRVGAIVVSYTNSHTPKSDRYTVYSWRSASFISSPFVVILWVGNWNYSDNCDNGLYGTRQGVLNIIQTFTQPPGLWFKRCNNIFVKLWLLICCIHSDICNIVHPTLAYKFTVCYIDLISKHGNSCHCCCWFVYLLDFPWDFLLSRLVYVSEWIGNYCQCICTATNGHCYKPQKYNV